VRQGHVVGTNGPVIEVFTYDTDGNAIRPQLTPFVPADDARLSIAVAAAPWVPVREVRIIVNGEVVRTFTTELSAPADPFGTGGASRLHDIGGDGPPLADLLPASGDAWLVVEAGAPLPLAADLDCDGIVDTGDNNGDGTVDWRDVDRNDDDVVDEEDLPEDAPPACDSDVGPLVSPPVPTQPNDPAYIFDAVVPGGYPFAFTNPLYIDRTGDGFGGPGR